MTELEQRLSRLASELDWPEAPELASAVRRRIASQPTQRSPRVPGIRLRRSLAIAVLGLLVLAGGVFAAVPSVRDAVLDLFGLRGATVERREQLPRPPDLARLDLGDRVTLARARDLVGFAPVLPEAAGRPGAVYFSDAVPGGELSLAYPAGPEQPEARTTGLGLLLSQFRGDLTPDYYGKLAGQATVVDELTLNGERALWLEGAPHLFFYRPPGEPFRDHALRLAENVLLLEHGRLLMRFEGAFTRERALELARSIE